MTESSPADDGLPHDPYAERVLLGSILLEPDRWPEAASLNVTAFYLRRHQAIFRGISQAVAKFGQPDLVTVASAVRQESPDAVAYLASLHGGAWKGAQIPHYVKLLGELEARRDAMTAGEAITHLAAAEGIGAAQDALGALTRRLDGATSQDQHLHVIDAYEALTGAIEPIPWMVPGWFSKGERIIIGGEWSSGKSVVALDLSIALALGGVFLGTIQVQGGPYRVLYVDEENGSALAKKRLRQLQNGKGVTSEASLGMPLRYLSKNAISFATDKGCATFRREVAAFRPDVIVLDSVIRFFSGDNENDNSQWAQFMSEHIMPLNAEGVSWVLLDHVRKPAANGKHIDEDIGQRIRGASDKPGSVDEVWCIAGDRHTNKRTMTHERTRWDEYQPAMQLSWTTSDDKESALLEATPEKQGCEDLILLHLNRVGDSGLARKDLGEILYAAGFHRRSYEKALTSLAIKGQTRKAKDNGKAVRLWSRIYAPEHAE